MYCQNSNQWSKHPWAPQQAHVFTTHNEWHFFSSPENVGFIQLPEKKVQSCWALSRSFLNFNLALKCMIGIFRGCMERQTRRAAVPSEYMENSWQQFITVAKSRIFLLKDFTSMVGNQKGELCSVHEIQCSHFSRESQVPVSSKIFIELQPKCLV